MTDPKSLDNSTLYLIIPRNVHQNVFQWSILLSDMNKTLSIDLAREIVSFAFYNRLRKDIQRTEEMDFEDRNTYRNSWEFTVRTLLLRDIILSTEDIHEVIFDEYLRRIIQQKTQRKNLLVQFTDKTG